MISHHATQISIVCSLEKDILFPVTKKKNSEGKSHINIKVLLSINFVALYDHTVTVLQETNRGQKGHAIAGGVSGFLCPACLG